MTIRPSILAGSIVALALALVASATLFAQESATGDAYRVIVHPGNALSSVDRQLLDDAFLKKVRTWPGGEIIRPVDLPLPSAVRRRFSQEVLRRSVEAIRSYWNQRIFSGRDLPPPELASDREVTRYVLRHPGAVGYVSADAALGGAKAIAVKW
jgi:hypothetical protein